MEALWLLLRAESRQRWRPMLGLALLLGVVGAVVLTAAAGARRTGTAYPRLLHWANAGQVELAGPRRGPGQARRHPAGRVTRGWPASPGRPSRTFLAQPHVPDPAARS